MDLLMNQHCLAERHHQRKKKTSPTKKTSPRAKRLDSLLENFTAMFGVISYIILGKTEDSGSFTTNHSVESSLFHKKELSITSRANKTLRYFGLRPSALAIKTETTQMEKRKLYITLEVLNEAST